LLGIAVYLHLDDRPEQAAWLSPSRKALLMQDLAAEAKAKRAHGHSSFLLALRDRRFYMLAGMAVALISGLAGLNIWLPTIIRNGGTANLLDIGLLSSLPYAVGVLAQLANGWHSDRTQERRWHAALPALAAGLGWCALPLATGHAGLSLALTILISAGSFAATAPFWTLPSLYLSGTAAAGGIATITTLGGLGAFVSPAVVGFLTSETGSLALGQCYYGLLLCLGAGMLVLGTRVPSPAAVRPSPAETVATS
jgi:nitrate/nitrite transporter NarK